MKAHNKIISVDEINNNELKDFKRKIHETIKNVTRDIQEEKQFNTAIARLMELTNSIYQININDDIANNLKREAVEILLNCLSPFCPHITEELWQMLGHENILSLENWPKYDEKALIRDNVTIIAQINGKVRGKFERPAGISEDDLKATILSEKLIQEKIAGKNIIKIITVPDKLINIVVK